jgi:hypothetical protein
MCLLSLAAGAVVVDVVGVRPLFWAGGALLALAGVRGVALLGTYNSHQQALESTA